MPGKKQKSLYRETRRTVFSGHKNRNIDFIAEEAPTAR